MTPLPGDEYDNILAGGDGDDTYSFDTDSALGSDQVSDDSGTDTLDFSLSTTKSITIDLSITDEQTINSNLTLQVAGVEGVVGGTLADSLDR